MGLDFIDEATRHLMPGKAALVAELDEEWVIPVDTALEAAGGQVFRRSRLATAEAQFDHDSQAQGEAKTRVEERMQRVKGAYHARGAKLSQAWSLTKEALAM